MAEFAAESLKKLNTSNVVLSFIVCSNQNRSALVRDLLSYMYNSLFVGQLNEIKSPSLYARDLIFFFTTTCTSIQ